jgi:hypothetical protein
VEAVVVVAGVPIVIVDLVALEEQAAEVLVLHTLVHLELQEQQTLVAVVVVCKTLAVHTMVVQV